MLGLHMEIKTALLNKLCITMGTLMRLSILVLLQMIVHGTLIVGSVITMGANKGTVLVLDVGIDHSACNVVRISGAPILSIFFSQTFEPI